METLNYVTFDDFDFDTLNFAYETWLTESYLLYLKMLQR